MAKRPTINWRFFGRSVRECRMSFDLGLRQAARQTGIDKGAWVRAEAGKALTPENYLAFCFWLGASPFDYFKSQSVPRRTAHSS